MLVVVMMDLLSLNRSAIHFLLSEEKSASYVENDSIPSTEVHGQWWNQP